MAQWSIDRLEVSGGYLSDLNLHLPSGLICVIGPRGSGKSTLAEAIRLTLCGTPNGATKPRLDLIKANLGNSVITINTTPSQERGGFTIRRSFGQQPIIISSEGRSVSAVDLDRGTFLPLDAYSSIEMDSIADETLGAKRRAIVDDLCSSEMQTIHLRLAEQARALESNADGIRAALRRIGDITEQIEELGDAKGRLDAIPAALSREGPPEFQVATRQRQFNERESVTLSNAIEGIDRFKNELVMLESQSRTNANRPLRVEGSANSEILAQIEESVDTAWDEVSRHLAEAGEAITRTLIALRQTKTTLAEAHARQENNYLILQQQNKEAALAVQARSAAERDLSLSQDLVKQRSEAQGELRRLNEERKALKAEYLLTRDQISRLRENVAARLQSEAGPKVRIRVQRNADVLEYQQRLMGALQGSKLKNQVDILRALSLIRPEDLAQIIRDDDVQELEAQAPFGKERGRKILDSLRQNIDPLALEILAIDDAVSIELDVSTSSPENYKDASELSSGQKCTALLPILLARRDTPLIIDQPEDNLDNHFIYQTVVESILRLKRHRQMIFITHNANIPVLGEAELVVVLNSDGRRGFIEKAGTVDECRTQIIDLLEGGEEAFALRSRRYGA